MQPGDLTGADAPAVAAAAERRAFREFVRRNHPDVGGDPEAFRAGLEAFRARAATGPAGPVAVHHPVEAHHRRHGAAVLLDWLAAARRRRRRPPRVT